MQGLPITTLFVFPNIILSYFFQLPPGVGDVETQGTEPARFLLLRARARRVSTTTTLCLLMVSLVVVGIGIVGGTYLYQQYLRSERHFRAWCNIPYTDTPETAMLIDADSDVEINALRY